MVPLVARSVYTLRRLQAGLSEERLDELNAEILRKVNAGGSLFLSHTRLNGRYAIRVALGNPRTGARHMEQLWQALQAAAHEPGTYC